VWFREEHSWKARYEGRNTGIAWTMKKKVVSQLTQRGLRCCGPLSNLLIKVCVTHSIK
jgi:hypothetical protein